MTTTDKKQVERDLAEILHPEGVPRDQFNRLVEYVMEAARGER